MRYLRTLFAALFLLGVLSPPPAAAGGAPQYSAAPPRHVAFASEGARLVGDLYMPCSPGRHPLIIVLHAASSPTRDLALYAHLKQMLPALGVAVFVYDRRGSGESSGELASADYDALADDAIAARRALAKRPDIDATRVGYWGLSQGGWLSVLALGRDPSASLAISISAPMVTPDVQMQFAVANILRIRGFSSDQVDRALATREAVDRYMRGQASREQAEKAVAAVKNEPWFPYSYIGAVEPRETSHWAKEITHDPLQALQKIHKPLLVLYGSSDPWVPVDESIRRLGMLEQRMPDLTVRVIHGADHAMMQSVSPREQIDTSTFVTQHPEAAEYFAMLTGWLAAHHFVDASAVSGNDAARCNAGASAVQAD